MFINSLFFDTFIGFFFNYNFLNSLFLLLNKFSFFSSHSQTFCKLSPFVQISIPSLFKNILNNNLNLSSFLINNIFPVFYFFPTSYFFKNIFYNYLSSILFKPFNLFSFDIIFYDKQFTFLSNHVYLSKVKLFPYIKRKMAFGFFLDHEESVELLLARKFRKSHYFRIRGDLNNLVQVNTKLFNINFGLKDYIKLPVSFFFDKEQTSNLDLLTSSNKFMFRSTLSRKKSVLRSPFSLNYFSENFLSLISTYRANIHLKFKSFIPSYMC
jgi:hypothetical protein